MKESEFIEQNKEKWLEFEKNLQNKHIDPASTSKLFIQITDDLSYARTFYKNRSVRLYLNGVAKLLFNDLNKSHRKGLSIFIGFWKKDLPLTMYKARRAMLISFLVFVGCFSLGIVTSIQDKDFARQILSAGYVNMTNENIAKGEAMAVYKSDSELNLFLPILFNNLKVDFLTFFSGIFMAVGTLVVMVANGVMVGVFQYFFIERGLFWESFLAIWTHGALEISTIILSGGAGLTLGSGLIFPGTLTRFQALKISGMNGLKIIMGVVPVTFLAAFIEGFLTRHTDIPDPLRFIFILISFTFILSYFFYYPRYVAKRTPPEHTKANNILVYKPGVEFHPYEIHSAAKIITETFRLFFQHLSAILKYALPASALCALLLAFNPLLLFHGPENTGFDLTDLFNYPGYPFLGILTGIVITVMIIALLFLLKNKLVPEARPKAHDRFQDIYQTGLPVLLASAFFVALILSDIDYTTPLAHITLPFLIFIAGVSHFRQMSLFNAVSYAGNLLTQSFSKFMASAFVFALISLILYFTVIYGLKLLFLQDALTWMLTDNEAGAEKIRLGLVAFQTCFSFFLYLSLSVISNSLLYFTLNEAQTAEYLTEKIKNIRANK